MGDVQSEVVIYNCIRKNIRSIKTNKKDIAVWVEKIEGYTHQGGVAYKI